MHSMRHLPLTGEKTPEPLSPEPDNLQAPQTGPELGEDLADYDLW